MTSSTDMLVSSKFSSWDSVKDQFICLAVLPGVIFGSAFSRSVSSLFSLDGTTLMTGEFSTRDSLS